VQRKRDTIIPAIFRLGRVRVIDASASRDEAAKYAQEVWGK